MTNVSMLNNIKYTIIDCIDEVRGYFHAMRAHGVTRVMLGNYSEIDDEIENAYTDDPLENYDYTSGYLSDALKHLERVETPEAERYAIRLRALIADVDGAMDERERTLDIHDKAMEFATCSTEEEWP
ncbi:hypothetical protein FACS1894184_08600 [Clostridia bacterium]|nr:hypothetical protein FACS1894184_08600 [Clostridia bacterium]